MGVVYAANRGCGIADGNARTWSHQIYSKMGAVQDLKGSLQVPAEQELVTTASANNKKKWDSLKRDYANWKTLKNNSSGLGMDPNTGTIAASEEWWKLQCEAMPTCVKFRKGPLEYEELLAIIFEGASCTNASAVVPGVGEDMGDEGDQNEEGGASSAVSFEQSPMDDPVRKEIAILLDQVIDAGAIEGDSDASSDLFVYKSSASSEDFLDCSTDDDPINDDNMELKKDERWKYKDT
ncbi:hypothetical protein ABZP36_009843 [Zizania latifolia]